jgi:hypothetical protein
MQPLAVDAALLRTVLAGDIKLTIGRELMVRVAAVGADGHGVLSLAGMLLEAELPDNVHPGAELRLEVRELTPEKVVLAIQQDPPQQPPVAAPVEAPRVPLPGGGFVKVTERDGGRAGSGPGDQPHTLTVRYDAPALGQIDLHFTLSSGALALTVAVAPGAHETADDHAGQLQTTLAAATERPATVTVVARREPVEVFA